MTLPEIVIRRQEMPHECKRLVMPTIDLRRDTFKLISFTDMYFPAALNLVCVVLTSSRAAAATSISNYNLPTQSLGATGDDVKLVMLNSAC